MACAILHNFILTVNEGDELLQHYFRDGAPVSDMDLENAYPINYDVGANNVFPHGPAVCRNSAGRVGMNRFRDHLADQMWAAYTHPARDIGSTYICKRNFMATYMYIYIFFELYLNSSMNRTMNVPLCGFQNYMGGKRNGCNEVKLAS